MGTSPATAFKINQFSEDMSLDNVEVKIPGVRFDPSPFESAEEGMPVMMADSRYTRSSSISALPNFGVGPNAVKLSRKSLCNNS